jgi:hypothetical protein
MANLFETIFFSAQGVLIDMKKLLSAVLFSFLISCSGFAQIIEKINPLMGDWKATTGKYFCQVYVTKDSAVKINLTTDLTSRTAPVAVLAGARVSERVLTISGDGWTGKIDNGTLRIVKGDDVLEMQQYFRSSPTINAAPPEGAIVLFDGTSLDAWTKVMEKDWLVGGTPVDNWKIVPGGFLEVVPHAPGSYESIISRQQFGDIHLHVEFRLLGEPTNGGVYLMSRYEMNIKDAYGQVGGAPIGFGNISKPKDLYPDMNPAFPPMQWQTLDIDFRAPRFDASGTTKTENPRMTAVHNGITIYKDVELEAVKGSTAKLGSAGVGPIYLQEHGTAYQFRNIWVVDKTVKGTEKFGDAAAVAAAAGIINSTPDAVDKSSEGKKSGTNVGGERKKGGRKGGGKKNGANEISKTDTASVNDVQTDRKNGDDTSPQADVVAKKGKYEGGKKVESSYDAEANPAYAASTIVLIADASGLPAKPAGFIHPGILINRAQLEEIKHRVAANIEPQKSACEKLKGSPLGALDYKANPVEIVSCGPRSNPDIGCKAEQADCAAAYTQALLWVITGNKAYAVNAVNIMNTWSSTLTGGHNYANGPVQAAWCGSVWPRAAEIIRATYGGWSDSTIARFQTMLRVQYLPSIIHGDCENGNKELAMCEALINIGVFIEDRAVFDLGVKMWRGRTPAYIYLKSDGPKPIDPPGCGAAIWSNKGLMPELVDGLLQETARDSHHPWYAFSSMANAAETARQQGVDLYGEEGRRMMAALEFQAQYLSPNTVPPPENLEFALQPTWEIAFNHFHNRMGLSLPKMAAVIPTNRPTGANHHMLWETLTHGDIGAIGLPPIKK